jgi:nucleoside-diphosphate-sugar epimerase
MARVLFIGGTGEISFPCVEEAVRIGHNVTVFNRGHASERLPEQVSVVCGDLRDAQAYQELAGSQFDVVCQFIAFDLADAQRDVSVFAGNCNQYVFISTASAYEKPPQSYVITEEFPLENPFWDYSQRKADMESLLMDQHRRGRFNVTIVRPSHTVRKKFPGGIVRGDDWAWRLKNNKPLLIHGDGTALWTLTHAEDFARPFARLLGNRDAFGQSFHITRHMEGYTWNAIFAAMASALATKPLFVHVPSDVLVRYNREWTGPLFGDKSHSVLFDNSKVMRVAGNFTCDKDLAEIMRSATEHYRCREASYQPDPSLHALLDQIAVDMGELAR